MHIEFSYSLLLAFLLLVSTIFLLQITSFTKKKKRLPPGPNGFPIIGSLHTLGDRPHESLANLAKQYGALMTLQLGFVTTVVASSADMAKEILQKHDQAFVGRHVPEAITAEKDYDLSVAWISGSTPLWRKLRKICVSELLTPQRLDGLQELRHERMNKMLKRVAEARAAGEAINIGRLVFTTMLNLLANTMFSFDMLDPNSDDLKELKELMSRLMELAGKPNMADYFPLLKPFDPQGIKRTIRVSYDSLHALIHGVIDRRKKRRASGSAKTGDFLDALLDHCDGLGHDHLTLQEIVLLFADLFIGGTDTTTTTMEWIMTELLRNPRAMAKAKQELLEKIGPPSSSSGAIPQEQDIANLPYLAAIIKETMRLHPTVPLLLPHRAETDVEVCGFLIPKHTQVLVNVWAISRDTASWDDPTKFMPERFMGSEIDLKGRHFCLIPFSAGRRLCPGLNLAVRMMSLMVATLVHNFDWKLPNGMAPEDLDMKDRFGVTLQKADPLVAIPV